MIEYKNEKLGVSFSLPEKITVRMQLAYFSETALAIGKEMFERYWRGAVSIVQDWKCEALPDAKADLDSIADAGVVDVIIWTAIEVKRRMDALEEIPKN